MNIKTNILKSLKIWVSIATILLLSLNLASAQIIIYDNVTTSQYKTIKITSDLCIAGISDCKHALYINGFFSQYFQDGDLIEISDGSNVVVVLDDPINTNLENIYDTGKSNITIAIMYFVESIIIILIIYLLIMYTIKKYRRRR
jgi:hypothetical protein